MECIGWNRIVADRCRGPMSRTDVVNRCREPTSRTNETGVHFNAGPGATPAAAPRPTRDNGGAPGVNILPEQHTEQAIDPVAMQRICQSIPMGRIGTPQDIAETVLFLVNATYITGQIIAVDGGRSLTLG